MDYSKEIKDIEYYFDLAILDVKGEIKFEEKVKMQEKINAYSIIYQICISNLDIDKADDGAIFCYEFYKRKMKEYCQEISKQIKEEPLNLLNKFYPKFKFFYKWLNTIFCYLDRHYIKNNDLPDIKKKLPHEIFFDTVLRENKDDFCINCNNQLSQIRINYIYESNMIIKGFEIVKELTNSTSFFDDIVLEVSNKYYKSKKSIIKETLSGLKYLEESKKLFDKELKLLLSLYNHENGTIENLNLENLNLENLNIDNTCIIECLHNYLYYFYDEEYDLILDNSNDGLNILLKNDKITDIKYIYNLLNYSQTIVQYMSNIFLEFTQKLLRDFNKINFKDIVVIIKRLFEIVEKGFEEDSIILTTLKKEIEKVINSPANKPQSFIKSLIKYFKDNIAVSIILVKYIHEKDYFFEIYLADLETRYLTGKVDILIEEEILDNFKKEYRTNYINKYQTILNDIKSTKLFNQDFNEFLFDKEDEVFNSKILTSGIWSTIKDYEKDIILPQELSKYQVIMEEYYKFKYSDSRKINFAHKHGEIILSYNENLEIKTVPLIGILLLLFNESSKFSIDEIVNKTKLSSDDVENGLNSILNHPKKLITKENDFYLINEIEKNDKLETIEINFLQEKKEIQIKEKVDNFKKYRTEACLVNIMKRQEYLEHNELVEKVSEKMKQWGSSIELIEKCIENLVEKEYIEKKDNGYNYCP
ncbi:Cullin family [seawater metagenome]|uniref:Cullin family n=1 Tax=seawater metagenome TaxID=1561972 RepID=A0A5E8CIB9_9ZZZZ